MRILYVINSLDGGGGALPLPRVLGLMRDAGHEVEVVAMMRRDGRACEPLRDAGFDFAFVGAGERRWLAPAGRLYAHARTWRPDLIWTSLSPATITGQLVGRALGVPVVSWLHNAWLKPANVAILRRTAPLTRHWIADSEASTAFGVATLGLPRSRISVWPLFCADPDQPVARAWADGRFRIGSLGRLHPQKGYDVLIDALARARDFDRLTAERIQVEVAGEGPLLAELRRRARERGLTNIVFPGFVSRPATFLASLHAYVQPSRHEGLCIAAHEAMAAGLPVIASPVGEMAHSLPAARAGRLVAHGDVDGLADAMLHLARNPDLAHRIGMSARKWTQARFSENAFRQAGLAAMTAAGVD